MGIKAVLGLESKKKVRYAFVALGDIAQEAMLPGVAHTGNSRSRRSSPPIGESSCAGRPVRGEGNLRYEQFDELLRSGTVDAIYLSTPNARHAEFAVTTGDGQTHESFRNTDHFGGELAYFSDCILNGRDPEPDGEEGYADVRVIEGILEALKTGGRVVLPPFARTRRIDPDAQERTLAARKAPELVNASNPGRGVEKTPRN